ncbi:MAG: pilus assembly protein [Anaerolineaceae bacterium]|nr:MAG: pilus assembly protein [Anaerolineaceae bacterium]
MNHGRKNKDSGQALVEFALVFPILMLLLFGIIEFGRIIYTYTMSVNAVRTAVRTAVLYDYEDGSPLYLDCERIRRQASELPSVRLESVIVQYEIASTGQIIACDADAEELALVGAGDMLQIELVTRIDLVTPIADRFSGNWVFRLSGQRTIAGGVEVLPEHMRPPQDESS